MNLFYVRYFLRTLNCDKLLNKTQNKQGIYPKQVLLQDNIKDKYQFIEYFGMARRRVFLKTVGFLANSKTNRLAVEHFLEHI